LRIRQQGMQVIYTGNRLSSERDDDVTLAQAGLLRWGAIFCRKRNASAVRSLRMILARSPICDSNCNKSAITSIEAEVGTQTVSVGIYPCF